MSEKQAELINWKSIGPLNPDSLGFERPGPPVGVGVVHDVGERTPGTGVPGLWPQTLVFYALTPSVARTITVGPWGNGVIRRFADLADISHLALAQLRR